MVQGKYKRCQYLLTEIVKRKLMSLVINNSLLYNTFVKQQNFANNDEIYF